MRLAGMTRIGAFHGGLVAASLDEATQHMLHDWIGAHDVRCITLEIDYLRPAFANDPLLADARVEIDRVESRGFTRE